MITRRQSAQQTHTAPSSKRCFGAAHSGDRLRIAEQCLSAAPDQMWSKMSRRFLASRHLSFRYVTPPDPPSKHRESINESDQNIRGLIDHGSSNSRPRGDSVRYRNRGIRGAPAQRLWRRPELHGQGIPDNRPIPVASCPESARHLTNTPAPFPEPDSPRDVLRIDSAATGGRSARPASSSGNLSSASRKKKEEDSSAFIDTAPSTLHELSASRISKQRFHHTRGPSLCFEQLSSHISRSA